LIPAGKAPDKQTVEQILTCGKRILPVYQLYSFPGIFSRRFFLLSITNTQIQGQTEANEREKDKKGTLHGDKRQKNMMSSCR
jgi:hypothetical protein